MTKPPRILRPPRDATRKQMGLPSGVNVLSRITRARNMDVRALTYDQVLNRIKIIMGAYLTQRIPLMFNGAFRARRNSSSTLFEDVRELWYPPSHVIQQRGRFNPIGESQFYASRSAQGAIYEVHPGVGDHVTVLFCAARNVGARHLFAQIGLERCLADELAEIQGSVLPGANDRFQELLRSKGLSTSWRRTDEYLGDMATALWAEDEEQDRYKITNAIASVLLRIPDIVGINYPSVASSLQGINLCIPPNQADMLFEAHEAWVVRIDERRERIEGTSEHGPFFRTTFLKRSSSIDEGGRINWVDIEPGYPIETLLRVRQNRAPQSRFNLNPSSTPQ